MFYWIPGSSQKGTSASSVFSAKEFFCISGEAPRRVGRERETDRDRDRDRQTDRQRQTDGQTHTHTEEKAKKNPLIMILLPNQILDIAPVFSRFRRSVHFERHTNQSNWPISKAAISFGTTTTTTTPALTPEFYCRKARFHQTVRRDRIITQVSTSKASMRPMERLDSVLSLLQVGIALITTTSREMKLVIWTSLSCYLLCYVVVYGVVVHILTTPPPLSPPPPPSEIPSHFSYLYLSFFFVFLKQGFLVCFKDNMMRSKMNNRVT